MKSDKELYKFLAFFAMVTFLPITFKYENSWLDVIKTLMIFFIWKLIRSKKD